MDTLTKDMQQSMDKSLGLEGRKRWSEEDLAPYVGTYVIRTRWTTRDPWITTGKVTLSLPRNEAEWNRPWLGMVAHYDSGREGYITPGAVRHLVQEGFYIPAHDDDTPDYCPCCLSFPCDCQHAIDQGAS